jgi:hypothetical protein
VRSDLGLVRNVFGLVRNDPELAPNGLRTEFDDGKGHRDVSRTGWSECRVRRVVA